MASIAEIKERFGDLRSAAESIDENLRAIVVRHNCAADSEYMRQKIQK